MITKELTIQNPIGLHARPAGLFVKTAQKFDCEIMVRKGEKEVKAKSLFAVMGLAVKNSEVITVSCDGADEINAMQAICDAVESGLGE